MGAKQYFVMQPSIQKVVSSVAQDTLAFLTAEAVQSIAYTEDTPGVDQAVVDVATEFTSSMVEPQLLTRAIEKAKNLAAARRKQQEETVRYLHRPSVAVLTRNLDSKNIGDCDKTDHSC